MKHRFQTSGAFIMMLLALTSVAGFSNPAFGADKQKTNEAITTVILDRLESDSIATGNSVQVTVANDTVTLSGVVNSVADVKRAVTAAHDIAHNYEIVDNLQVKPMSMTDLDLAEEVAASIKHNVFYSVFDWIVVNAHNGEVTLSGWAAQPWRKQDYLHQAEKVPGVTKVVDNITLLPTSGFDDEIRHRAYRAIYDDPMFEQWVNTLNPPIHIVVDNGTVLLLGNVRSEVEKRVAGNLVAFNTNAFHVDNQLVIAKP